MLLQKRHIALAAIIAALASVSMVDTASAWGRFGWYAVTLAYYPFP
jgi:hypothetical protein